MTRGATSFDPIEFTPTDTSVFYPFVAKLGAALNVSENTLPMVTLYPNPSSGNSALNITLQHSARLNIQVLDASGSILQQRGMLLPSGNSSIPINIIGYSNGVYTISVQYNNERKIFKLIKN